MSIVSIGRNQIRKFRRGLEAERARSDVLRGEIAEVFAAPSGKLELGNEYSVELFSQWQQSCELMRGYKAAIKAIEREIAAVEESLAGNTTRRGMNRNNTL